MKTPRLVLVVFCTTLLASCAQYSTQIGSNLTVCCPGNYSEYADYSIDTVDMPIFLRDYVIAEFDAAFSEKGLVRNDRMNDVRVLLRYNHINLTSEQETIDPFVRAEGMNVELNYVAAIDIEIRETASDDVVWAGTISRIHQVVPGEYMHEDRARPAFRQAFRAVLSSYPPLNDDPS